jgi:hypothetical protein
LKQVLAKEEHLKQLAAKQAEVEAAKALEIAKKAEVAKKSEAAKLEAKIKEDLLAKANTEQRMLDIKNLIAKNSIMK